MKKILSGLSLLSLSACSMPADFTSDISQTSECLSGVMKSPENWNKGQVERDYNNNVADIYYFDVKFLGKPYAWKLRTYTDGTYIMTAKTNNVKWNGLTVTAFFEGGTQYSDDLATGIYFKETPEEVKKIIKENRHQEVLPVNEVGMKEDMPEDSRSVYVCYPYADMGED